MARRVLVVDDEQEIRTVLRAYLEHEGFDVAEAGTGAEALRRSLATDGTAPDVVLLDIGLPDLGGLDVLRTIRRSSDVYVLLVTARADEVDTLVGLGAGADDYVTKPFSPREVVARVGTVLRRSADRAAPHVPDERVLRFERLTLDERRRELTVDDGEVRLSTLEFDLLHALAASPGRVFSRAQLLEKVWGYDFYGDERVVDVHVRSVRRALGDDAADPRVIGTVRGVGYKFLLPRAGAAS
ncbi:response regulator transcription factor [Phycicoccus sp. HDW14]|uniref:response regulator transcription factor n=1 Tax=Phycicoccus sp. HDW14 TaxID=2714941 RepID=UPI00140A37BB|nr:response regulator transcription factor [Phycicoccus sp. HDW14]QIM20135.1 response regulator transcription factor [Phycicoccus sp. HDW14]